MTTKVTAAMLAADVIEMIEGLIPPASGVPPGVGFEWYGANLPAGGYLWQDGAAVSRTTYAALYAVIGTTYGTGDGSTTFNLPDSRGRVVAGKDNMGGTAANRLTTAGGGVNGAALGASGGSQTHTLTAAQIPAHTHPVTDPTHSHGGTYTGGGAGGNFGVGDNGVTGSTAAASTGISVGNNTGGGGAHPIVQPTLVANKVIKY